MIQLTVYLNPDELTWYKDDYITVREWLKLECKYIQDKTGKRAVIKSDKNGHQAIFRERKK